MKLKNAPYLKRQNINEPLDELIILAGSQAWEAYGKEGNGQGWLFLKEILKIRDNTPPVILGDKHLGQLNCLRLAPENRKVIGIYQFGELNEAHKTAICANLSKHTQAETVLFYDNIGQTLENASDYIKRTRAGETMAETVAEAIEKVEKRQPYIEKRISNGITGLFRIIPKYDNNTGELLSETEQWLSDFVEVVGVGQSELETFIILQWTPEGQFSPIVEAVPLKELGEREGWKQLRQQGLKIANSSSLRNYLADHLQLSGNRQKWTITHTTGWKNGAYILPNGEIIGTPTTPTIFKGKSASVNGYSTNGTLESWRENVGNYLNGNPSMMLGVACALSAPLIGLIGADSFGVHLYGDSTTGKTTTALSAISLYGDPELLKLSWFGTTLGILNEGQAHNDNLLPMDEIGQGVNPKYVYETSYALFNGVGKLQGAKDGGNRELLRWRTVVFSTGEKDIETYLKMNGQPVNAGQLVRLLNVPITRAKHYHGFKDGKAHADHLNTASRSHYGVVGRLWIEWIIQHKEQAIEIAKQQREKWLERLPADCSPQVQRVAGRFAVLETALQLASHLTQWSIESNSEAMLHCFNEWVKEFGMHSREERQIIDQVNGFLLSQMGRYIKTPINHDKPEPFNVAGFAIEQGEELLFYTFKQVYLNEIINGFNEKQANEILFNAGMLKKDKGKHTTQKLPLKYDKKRTRCYVLTTFDESQEEEE
ncbi:DUF927 domain-containing protein [Mannheimia haemolytica]|uniref:DUF927 domain-containing protein n=1 Tax=Mannheimia haemolytica TaxID=75985 RepID=UPI002EC5B394|nr:DUF927 domain-containing protein [Mannheimia haemolytica]